MKASTKSLFAGAALVTAFLAAPARPATAPALTIYETAKTGGFTTLATALELTGLDAALDTSDGPRYTVFAPTDAAFAALPPGILNDLLADPEALADVLLYHALGEAEYAADVVATTFLTTLNGQRVDIEIVGQDVFVDQARIEMTDIQCSNGVIHVIDAVLVPNDQDLVGTAVAAGDFSSLVAAVSQLPNLVNKLTSDKQFTVFAPNDAAFAAIPAERLSELLNGKPESKQLLDSILRAHIVPRRIYADQLIGQTEVTTISGVKLPVQVIGNDVFVAGVRILATDIETTNGNIHVLEGVIVP